MTEAQNTQKPLTQGQQRNLIRLLEMDYQNAAESLSHEVYDATRADLKKAEDDWLAAHPEVTAAFAELQKISKAANKKLEKVREEAEANGFRCHVNYLGSDPKATNPMSYFQHPGLEEVRKAHNSKWAGAHNRAYAALTEARVQAEREILLATVTDAPLTLIKLPSLADVIKAAVDGS